MIIIELLAAFLGSIAFLALCSKGLAYHWAMYTVIAFNTNAKGIYSNDIYSRMPSVLNGTWWVLAGTTSALISAAFVTRSEPMIAISLAAIGVTIAYAGIRSHQLVKDAAREVGVPWPSESQS